MFKSADGNFAAYLAKRLTGEKRFRPGAPYEAAPLEAASDVVLIHAEFALTIACIIDGEGDPQKRFAASVAGNDIPCPA